MTFSFRRVVTAHDEDGKSVVWEHVPVSPTELKLLPGVEFYHLWGTDDLRDVRPDAPMPVHHPFVPSPGGSRWGIVVFPPESDVGRSTVDPTEGLADAGAKMPGLLSVMEPHAPGFHATPTIDYDIVLAGELHLELDDGVKIRLPAGSCVAQHGTRHAWRNHGTVPAILAYVLLGTG